MFQTFFTRRALKGELGIQRALGHSGTQGTWALGDLATQALWHSGTRGTLFRHVLFLYLNSNILHSDHKPERKNRRNV